MNKEEITEDVFLVHSKSHDDNRGFFIESYNKNNFQKLGINNKFIQDNISFSKTKNTIRGLHYQKKPFDQSKFVFVIKGSILDVFVDVRPDSKSFGTYYSVTLDNPEKGLFLPKGFLHGFCTLEDNTIVGYKVDQIYKKENEIGVFWNDKDLKINWNIDNKTPIVSKKDSNLLKWKEFINEIN